MNTTKGLRALVEETWPDADEETRVRRLDELARKVWKDATDNPNVDVAVFPDGRQMCCVKVSQRSLTRRPLGISKEGRTTMTICSQGIRHTISASCSCRARRLMS